MSNYHRRVEQLEALNAQGSWAPPRIFVSFVNMQREAVTLLGDGQWFHRAEGESEDEFRQRARRAVGWDD